MADKAWSLIYGLDGSQFYEAAQAGVLTGAAPFSIGVVFMFTSPRPPDMTLFGNAVYGTSGAGIHTNAAGFIEAANGTILQPSGTVIADADGTYSANEQNLLNNYKSLLTNPTAPVGGTPLSWPTPRSFQLTHVHMDVGPVNQETFCNGRLVAQTARALVTNANPFRIGCNGVGGNPMGQQALLVGCYYHSAILGSTATPGLFNLIVQNKDIPARFDYVWSVRQGNFDARSTWLSAGLQSPIAMELTGVPLIPAQNVLSMYDTALQWS